MKLLSDFSQYKEKTISTPRAALVVWAGVLDSRYAIEIERTEPYKGVFKIKDLEGEFSFKEETSISYDAQFGPDICDIQRWQNRGVEVIDDL